MKRKIDALFLDVDGTLVSFDTHVVPQSAREALRQAHEAGVKIIIATGRSAADLHELEGIPYDAVVALNGADCVLRDGTVVARSVVNYEDFCQVYALAQQWGCPLAVETNEGIFVNAIDDRVRAMTKLVNHPLPTVAHLEEVFRAAESCQLCIYCDEDTEKQIMEQLPQLESTRWNPLLADLSVKGIDKSVGVQAFCAYYGMERERTAAFGDGENDIPMLRAAGIGVAMGQASEAVRAAADVLADTVEADGLQRALQQILSPRGCITVVGIGPGSAEDMTPAVQQALHQADVVVGYKYYFQFVRPFLRPETECVDTGMKSEVARAEQAFVLAEAGKRVCVISSGDAGIYGMASLVYEMKRQRASEVEVNGLPGISAFQKAAALLGAPVSHDFCVISLSDLMTPWELIERRIRAAALGDFVTAVYNPRSGERYWQLNRLREIFLQEGRAPQTPVGFVRQAGREQQEVHLTTLEGLEVEEIDMFTIVLIGNSQSYSWQDKLITPRGYYREEVQTGAHNVGQDIMIRSFRTIERELRHREVALDYKWALLHAIHTTADFEMERLLLMSPGAVERMYRAVSEGRVKTIVTDVTMVASGIRKGALQRLGVEVKCYLHDPRTAQLAAEKGITRTQAGIRLAVEEHPEAIYAFGNAPTALIELCEWMRKGKARPSGVIAAPVGFVHVEESKHRVKVFREVPQLIVEGRKGGSNLAATLVNAVLCFNDAQQLKPGRDV